MINSVLEPITILTSNTSAITFTDDDVRTRKATCCGWLQHDEGSPIYKILEGGLYEVKKFLKKYKTGTINTTIDTSNKLISQILTFK